MTYSLKDAGARKREIEGLRQALREFKLDRDLILKYDELDPIEVEGKKIDVMPIWQWLLRD